MPGNAAIDTAIGLAFVFFLVALVCTAVVEAIANLFKKRAKYLLRGMRDMLDTPDSPTPDQAAGARRAPRRADGETSPGETQPVGTIVAAASHEKDLYNKCLAVRPLANGTTEMTLRVMAHPLVRPFKTSRAGGIQTRNPSYLPAKTFARALVDLLVPDATGATTIDWVRSGVDAMPENESLKRALLSLLNAADDDLTRFMTSLEKWYDDNMDRISGAYKRWAKRWVIVVALVVAGGLQVDAIAVGNALYRDAPLREAVVAAAGSGALCRDSPDAAATGVCVDRELTKLKASAGLPVGWSSANHPTDAVGWVSKAVGWSLTAFAATFGAPFWFDTLNRLGSLRNTGRRPEPTPAT